MVCSLRLLAKTTVASRHYTKRRVQTLGETLSATMTNLDSPETVRETGKGEFRAESLHAGSAVPSVWTWRLACISTCASSYHHHPFEIAENMLRRVGTSRMYGERKKHSCFAGWHGGWLGRRGRSCC